MPSPRYIRSLYVIALLTATATFPLIFMGGLVTSHGAGAEMRRAMGVAVFSGMLGVTFFGLLLTPVFYLVIRKVVEARRGSAAAPGVLIETSETQP